MLKQVSLEVLGFLVGVGIWVVVGTTTDKAWLAVVSMLSIASLTFIVASRMLLRAKQLPFEGPDDPE